MKALFALLLLPTLAVADWVWPEEIWGFSDTDWSDTGEVMAYHRPFESCQFLARRPGKKALVAEYDRDCGQLGSDIFLGIAAGVQEKGGLCILETGGKGLKVAVSCEQLGRDLLSLTGVIPPDICPDLP